MGKGRKKGEGTARMKLTFVYPMENNSERRELGERITVDSSAQIFFLIPEKINRIFLELISE